MMKEEIRQRVERLRQTMRSAEVDALIIPSSDRHLSEYTPVVWQHRQWITGFMGSAGTAVVTADDAALWTDSRYFLEAGKTLEGTPFTLMREGLPDTPSITQYLREKSGVRRVGFFGRAVSAVQAETFLRELRVAGIEVVTERDFVAEIQGSDAPSVPMNKFSNQPIEYAGQTTDQKVSAVRAALKKEGASAIIMTMLDEVAWLFNIRNNDVAFNPVGIAYGLITADEVVLYTFGEKLTEDVLRTLTQNSVTIRDYDTIYRDVAALSAGTTVLVDMGRTNFELYSNIPASCTQIHKLSPITLLKAQKNEAEYEGYRKAMRRDAVALTRFFMWLERELNDGRHPSEYEIGNVLSDFRAKGDYYVSDSFGTIAGYRGNGAIVHYSAEEESSSRLDRSGLFLLDSGGQYLDGTTDITRTISLDGHPTAQEKHDYTLVLKGHIAIATAIYPEGTRGSQLDVLARKALWDEGKHYGHGTGHGVGHFLNVHEGPQNIRMDENPTPLMLGMVTSNEPGYYLADNYGIRIENLVRTVPAMESEGIRFFGFETLTLCYLDNSLVEIELLTDKELQWYNEYQAWVHDEVSPLLDADEAEWLKAKTTPLKRK